MVVVIMMVVVVVAAVVVVVVVVVVERDGMKQLSGDSASRRNVKEISCWCVNQLTQSLLLLHFFFTRCIVVLYSF